MNRSTVPAISQHVSRFIVFLLGIGFVIGMAPNGLSMGCGQLFIFSNQSIRTTHGELNTQCIERQQNIRFEYSLNPLRVKHRIVRIWLDKIGAWLSRSGFESQSEQTCSMAGDGQVVGQTRPRTPAPEDIFSHFDSAFASMRPRR
jgi:hypothetical protein